MTTSISVGHSPDLHVDIRHVPVGRPLEWLSRGWDDFRAIGAAGLGYGALISILGGGSTLESHPYLSRQR